MNAHEISTIAHCNSWPSVIIGIDLGGCEPIRHPRGHHAPSGGPNNKKAPTFPPGPVSSLGRVAPGERGLTDPLPHRSGRIPCGIGCGDEAAGDGAAIDVPIFFLHEPPRKYFRHIVAASLADIFHFAAVATKLKSAINRHLIFRCVNLEPAPQALLATRSPQIVKSADPFAILSHVAHSRGGLFEIVEREMERTVAIKKLGNILGKSLGYRVDPKAPVQEERDEASAKLREEHPKRDALSKQMEARRIEILQADTEYQRLKAAHAEAKKRCDELFGITHRYRFTVGTSNSLFFMVKAQGDSWEEVIAKLTDKQAA